MASIKDLPDVRDTPEAKTFGDEVVHPGRKNVALANGATETRDRQPVRDQFWLSPESRTKYGIKDSEEIAWGLNTSDNTPWSGITALDRIEEITDNNPGSRVVTDPATGKPVRRRDLYLIARPKETVEAMHKRDMAAAIEAERQIKDGEHDDNFDALSTGEKKKLRAQTSRMLREGGFIGPTQGLSMGEAVRGRSRVDIEDELVQMRSQGRFSSAAEEADARKAAKVGRSSFGGLRGNPEHNKWETSADKKRALAGVR